MSSDLSAVISAQSAASGSFSANRFDLGRFGGLVSPVMGMDHYRMNAVTFAPHPHAGFSAISYLFEDSPGALRNRDSLGNDFDVEPGGLVWTQAGSGVVHDELPKQPGLQVHGLQIFVNLSAANKQLAPQVFRLPSADVPVWTDGAGNRVRVVVGGYGDLSSPVRPAEPFDLLDICVATQVDLAVRNGWNAMIYLVDGDVELRRGEEVRRLHARDAVGLAGDGSVVRLFASSRSQIVVLSGSALNEPVAQYGPFIMNRQDEIRAAMARYQSGLMGHLEPL